jgi:hypothetical protein
MSGYFVSQGSVWRIVHLLNAEDGPWRLVVKLRRIAGTGFWGEMLDCFYCLSVWIAAPFAVFLGERWTDQLLLWPALSGGAILLERLTSRGEQHLPVVYTEDQEEGDVLRQKQDAVSRNDGQPPAS